MPLCYPLHELMGSPKPYIRVPDQKDPQVFRRGESGAEAFASEMGLWVSGLGLRICIGFRLKA